MKKYIFPALILVAYCAFLVKVMVFKDMPTVRVGSLMLNFAGTDTGHGPNFIPFKTIFPYLLGYKGWIIAGINLFGNIALLVPVGFLLPFVYRGLTWKKSLVLAVAAGLCIEVMQTVLRVGIFDIDDVILNALGVMVGYGAFALLAQWLREKNYRKIAIATAVVVAASALVYGLVIYPMTHQPVNPGRGPGDIWRGSLDQSQEGEAPQTGDLCGGTGGTGEIVSKGDHTISIRRNDGVVQTLDITNKTDIQTPTGPASDSDLKIGDRVTIVVNDSKTADAVFVCSK